MRPVGAPAPITNDVYEAEGDGLAFAMRAELFGRSGSWGVVVSVEAEPQDTARAVHERALYLVPTLYRPDGRSSNVGVLSVGDLPGAECVPVGTSVTRTARSADSDLAGAGEVLRVVAFLAHGPCDAPDQQRTAVGAMEVRTRASGGPPAMLLWAPDQLSAAPEPFE